MNEHLPIFVYGTLKRGEQRQRMWPHEPVEVRRATVLAALYDLGPYPAMGEGEDPVAGELWFPKAEHTEATLAALDAIECFGQDDVDLYVRRIAQCREAAGELLRAYTYFYADEELLADARRVRPDSDGCCRWTAAKP